jgi:predicted O-linked N-acetylglucosamine transferase (SPINDLY family)
MDYLLADRYEVPLGAEAHIRERVLRMPDGYVCFDPPSDASPVSPLPALARGHVTFGSFNNSSKLTPEVVELWARILHRVKGSRLLLQYVGFEVPAVANRLVEQFARHEIEASRLELLGPAAHADFLRNYERVDIGLDPFPYSGGLTTCEALWMGVPVVTCPGETFASRHALSHLSNAGLTETIARDRAEYVELAASLAGDLPRLADLRARLRQQMAASPLCDGPRFADNLVNVLRGAWRRWCEEQSA